MALVKQKNSPYFYAVIYESPGKKKWKSTKTTDRRLAQKRHDKWTLEARRKRNKDYLDRVSLEFSLDREVILLKEVWDRYKKQLTHSPPVSNEIYWNKFLDWIHGKIKKIGDIDKRIALRFLTQYEDNPPKTFNNVKSSLSAIWRALSIYDIGPNPWAQIPNKQNDSRLYRPFTPVEVKRILKQCNNEWEQYCLVAFHTGLRFKDVIHLKWKQIKDNHIELVPAKTRYNKKAVVIELHPELREILISMFHIDDNYIFPKGVNDYKNRRLEGQFKSILDKAEIKDSKNELVGFPSFRSLFVTRCESAGIPQSVIQGIVGHGSPSMTKRYSHDMEKGKAIAGLKSIKEFSGG